MYPQQPPLLSSPCLLSLSLSLSVSISPSLGLFSLVSRAHQPDEQERRRSAGDGQGTWEAVPKVLGRRQPSRIGGSGGQGARGGSHDAQEATAAKAHGRRRPRHTGGSGGMAQGMWQPWRTGGGGGSSSSSATSW
jgi:hypothetical protein